MKTNIAFRTFGIICVMAGLITFAVSAHFWEGLSACVLGIVCIAIADNTEK